MVKPLKRILLFMKILGCGFLGRFNTSVRKLSFEQQFCEMDLSIPMVIARIKTCIAVTYLSPLVLNSAVTSNISSVEIKAGISHLNDIQAVVANPSSNTNLLTSRRASFVFPSGQ
jgi:hypothetical protein